MDIARGRGVFVLVLWASLVAFAASSAASGSRSDVWRRRGVAANPRQGRVRDRELSIDLGNLERALGVRLKPGEEKYTKEYRADEGGDDPPRSSAGILGTLSERGLNYVKDVLVNEILKEVTPLSIPDIAARVNSPIGRVDTTVTQIVLSGAEVQYSDLDLDESGITIYASGIKASVVMDWRYEYTATYVPFPVTDFGTAEVKVKGMQAGVSFSMTENNGTLKLKLQECGTYVEDLAISLHGGGSWLYKWFVYVFENRIRSSVETQITLQMENGVDQLDTWLLKLPRRIPIDDTSAIDVTVVHNPLISSSYLSVGARGEFVALESSQRYPAPNTELPAGLSCDQSLKMLTIAFSDYVVNSAGFVYYNSGFLRWDVDELPGKKYLNTASWRFIIPQLYRKYPNEDMVLTFAAAAAPTVDLRKDGISAVSSAEMTIKVKDSSTLEQTPVACISMSLSLDAVASLQGGNISAQASLNDLTVSLKWSDVGSFPVLLVQATVRTIVKDVVIPLLNLSLRKGFPIPTVAVTLEDSDLRYEDGYMLVCTDIHYTGGFFPWHWKDQSGRGGPLEVGQVASH